MKNYKNCRGFITVDYDEFKQSSYKGFEISIMDLSPANEPDEKILFNTGNPIIDHYALDCWLSKNELVMCANSSSVDHFFMDGNKWLELPLLIPEDDKEYKRLDEWIIAADWDEYRKHRPDDYWGEKALTVVVTSRFIGKSFAHLKKYYYNKIDKTNPLYNFRLEKEEA